MACIIHWIDGALPVIVSPQATPAALDNYGVDLTPAQEQAMWAEIQHNLQTLRSAGIIDTPGSTEAVTYTFPLRLAPGLPDYAGFKVSAFSDHNPAVGSVLDYNGGTRTYDGHRGTDYALWPFSWNKLDAGEMQVIAAAAGTIVSSANVDATDHNCNGSSPENWNYVALKHADGRMTIYGHMRYNSITSKTVGQTVAQGEYLGTAASSGNSSGPHLHFEVRYGGFTNAEWIDPYAGPNSQAGSLWADQRPYYDSAINKLSTHFSPPSTPDPCQPSIPNLRDRFTAPARIYFYGFFRDYQGSLAAQLKIFRPDGSQYAAWQYAPGAPAFSSTWSQGWVYDFTTIDPAGTWRFEAAYNGQVYETFFNLNGPLLVARDDFALTRKNTPITIFALQNDQAPNGDSLLITAHGNPASGAVSVVNSSLIYAPAVDFLGSDVFTYTVSSSTQHAEATVTVRVAAEVYESFIPLTRR